MTQQPDGQRNAATSFAFGKLKRLEKRVDEVASKERSLNFAMFHPNGRITPLEDRIEKLEKSDKENTKAFIAQWRSDIPSRKPRINPIEIISAACFAVIMISATAMVARIAYDFVTMPDGSAVQSAVHSK